MKRLIVTALDVSMVLALLNVLWLLGWPRWPW